MMSFRTAAALFSAALLSGALAAPALAQANNPCSGAVTLSLAGLGSSTTLSGNTNSATTDGPASCGGIGRDLWYKVVMPVAGQLHADTCSPGTNFDSVLALYAIPNPAAPCPVSGANERACNDDACGDTTSSVGAVFAAGETVYIRLGGFSGSTGAFTLNVSIEPPPPPPTAGPDVTVYSHTDVARYGTGTSNGLTVAAYAVGTESCNRGDAPVSWYDFSPRDNEHPVIAQNMYRLKTPIGAAFQRFEQLGQSWLKHGFASVNGDSCGNCIQPPDGGAQLGVSCSDPYGSGLNGDNTVMGRRSQVNATTGFFSKPVLQGDATGDATIKARIQIPTTDLTSQPAGTRYFIETHYVTQDDAQFVSPGASVAINGLNNATSQELLASSIGNSGPTMIGVAREQQPAITSWRLIDPTVTLVTADHDDAPNPNPAFPNTTIRSRFWVAAKATSLGGGLYRYEYAVYNHNSDRSAGSFSVAIPASAAITSPYFHHPMSHSGEPYSNAAWTLTTTGGRATFATTPYATDPNANAIRWGTMYNFGFTADVAPTTGIAVLGLFKPGAAPGAPASLDIPLLPVPTVPPPCAFDFNADGVLDPDDLADYIACYFNIPPCGAADVNHDGAVDPDDLSDFIAGYFAGC